ncbi:thioredoxin family protein [Sphingomonas elodea]|uniref:thioredoxin family protein n=1 Tax=Sphingomonas elodea TaxID=179878 RepID=UPI00026308EB|nr:thioredoxin family protein [Sphingomonas elodea]
MRRLLAAVLLASTTTLLAAAPAPKPAPRVGIASFEALPKPLPLPYDERADADAVVKAARARAIKAHKLLLIDLGGNWCLDCRLLAGTIELPTLKPWVERHYEIVAVDIGRFDRNLAIPARYGAGAKLEGVPALLVVDPRTDKLLNGGRVSALADARSLTPQALADWLAQWPR